MADHTAEPWRLLDQEADSVGRCITILGPDNDELASVYSLEDSTVATTRGEAAANAHLMAAAPGLLRLLRASLIFHAAPDWTPAMQDRWAYLTGGKDATTKGLCDAIREAIGAAVPGERP